MEDKNLKVVYGVQQVKGGDMSHLRCSYAQA